MKKPRGIESIPTGTLGIKMPETDLQQCHQRISESGGTNYEYLKGLEAAKKKADEREKLRKKYEAFDKIASYHSKAEDILVSVLESCSAEIDDARQTSEKKDQDLIALREEKDRVRSWAEERVRTVVHECNIYSDELRVAARNAKTSWLQEAKTRKIAEKALKASQERVEQQEMQNNDLRCQLGTLTEKYYQVQNDRDRLSQALVVELQNSKGGLVVVDACVSSQI